MLDYREKIDWIRIEYLEKYFFWSLKFFDCDSNLFLMNYIYDRLELNIEQRYWMAWLYGNTYNIATAWVIANEFPDFENVDIDRLTDWNSKNYKRLRYQKDQKWQKGHLPKMFLSYQELIKRNGDTQKSFFQKFITKDPQESFDILYKIIVKEFYKFGRYSAWFYLQTLKETCDLNIFPENLLLNHENTHTQRDGLCYSLAMDEFVGVKDLYKNNEVISVLNDFSKEFLRNFNVKYPALRADMFLLETVLCAFKKTFRRKKGRYLGYYLDRQYEDIALVESDNWPGINWGLLWQGRDEILDKRVNRKTGVVNNDMEYFLNTGNIKYFDYVQ